MSKSIYRTVNSVLDKLKSDNRITVENVKFGEPVDESLLSQVSEIPMLIQSLYRSADGISFSWFLTSDPTIRGGINIPTFANIHNSRWKRFYTLDFTDVNILFQKSCREDSTVIAESLEGDEDVELMGISGEVFTISNYFIAFSKTLGYKFWQETYNRDKNYTIDSIIDSHCYLW